MAMNPLFSVGLWLTVFFATAVIMVLVWNRASYQSTRLMEVTRAPLKMSQEQQKGSRVVGALLSLVRAVRTRLGFSQDEKLRQRLAAAGLREQSAVDFYFGLRMLGPVLAVLAGTFIRQNTFMWVIGLMALTYAAPDFWVSHRLHVRREQIRLGLPDALDLMVVCVDAGLGVDQALLRAGQELALSHPAISEEFMQTNFEQRAGKPRLDAWQSMAERTEVETVRSFVHMLAQTDRFGTPLVRALRVFADGVRQQRRQQAEEMAAKTTVKLIFPLVLFIFPSVFIVLLGPAVILISRQMQGIFR
jgi:tight adherence protein C